MNEWFLRVNEYEEYYDALCALFDDSIFKWVLMVHHRGKKKENPHFHAVFRSEITERELRDRLTAVLTKAKGNKNYSLKASDGSVKVKAYLFHEDSPVEYSKGVSEAEIQSFQDHNLEVQKGLKENTPHKIIDAVIARLDAQNRQGIPSHALCFRLLMEELVTRGDWIPNKYTVERWINKVRANYAQKSKDSCKTFVSTLYGEWYPQFAEIQDWRINQTSSTAANFQYSTDF